jgi:hypothetical protein
MMPRLFIVTLLACVAIAALPLASSMMLLSPPLLKPAFLFFNSGGITVRNTSTSGASSSPTPSNDTIDSINPTITPYDGSVLPVPLHIVTDEDLMRMKHEVLTTVYEKSLDRCFIGSEGTCSFLDLRLSATKLKSSNSNDLRRE